MKLKARLKSAAVVGAVLVSALGVAAGTAGTASAATDSWTHNGFEIGANNNSGHQVAWACNNGPYTETLYFWVWDRTDNYYGLWSDWLGLHNRPEMISLNSGQCKFYDISGTTYTIQVFIQPIGQASFGTDPIRFN